MKFNDLAGIFVDEISASLLAIQFVTSKLMITHIQNGGYIVTDVQIANSKHYRLHIIWAAPCYRRSAQTTSHMDYEKLWLLFSS